MILGIFWMAIANASSLLGAYAILGKVRTGQPSVDALLFLLVRLTLISAAILATGLAGIMTATGLGIVGTAVLAALLAAGVRPDWKAFRWPRISPWIAGFMAIVLVRLLLQVWFFSPYLMDTLSYHLPKVAEWTRAGAITPETGLDSRSTFPAGFELVEIWWVVFLHHDVLIEMAGLEFLALAFSATYALSRAMRLGERASFLAALLLALAPGLHLQATSCMNDAPAAALWVATAALLVARAGLGPVFMAVGLGTGIKATYAYALPGLLLLWFLWRREPGLPARHPRFAAGLAIMGLLVGGSWYARNAVFHGNPVHPVTFGGTRTIGDEPTRPFGPSLESLRRNALILADQRIHDPSPLGAMLMGAAGWGAGAFACGLPALLIALRRDAWMRRLLAGSVCSLVCVLCMAVEDPWYLRFVLFFPAPLAVAAGGLADSFRPAAIMVGAALIFQFLGTFIPADLSDRSLIPRLRGGWRDRSANLLGPVPGGLDPVACCVDGERPYYLFYRPDFARRIAYLRPTRPEELLSSLEREGIRLVFADRYAPVVAEGVRRGWLKPMPGNFLERR